MLIPWTAINRARVDYQHDDLQFHNIIGCVKVLRCLIPCSNYVRIGLFIKTNNKKKQLLATLCGERRKQLGKKKNLNLGFKTIQEEDTFFWQIRLQKSI